MLFRVIAIRNRDGARFVLCPGPFTHDEACTALAKFTRYPWRREQVEPIT